MKHEKLRVGLVINDVSIPSYIADFMRKSQQAEFYTLDALIVNKTLPAQIAFNFSFIKKMQFNLIRKIEQKLLPNAARVKSFFKTYSAKQLSTELNIDEYDLRTCEDKTTIARLKQKKIDVFIVAYDVAINETFLFEMLLPISNQGILFIDYASDSQQQKKLPVGFFPVLEQTPSSSFLIKKIAPNHDYQTLLQGKIYTAYFYLMNAINLLQSSHQHLHLVLEKISKVKHRNVANSQTLEKVNPFIYSIQQVPNLPQQLSYVVQTALHLFQKKWWKLQKKAMRWGVAYQFTNDWFRADLAQSIVVKNPPNHFLADPFVFQKNGVHYCFVEDLDYETNKGKITVYEVNHTGFNELGTALEEDFHLSYPFIFEVSGELFMCPETYQANEIRLYRCEQFPLKWKLHKTLKSNVSAADTNIFKWNEKWWMLTNIDSLGLDDHNSELHLFYADAFDATDWTPHPMNPIVFDPCIARNGGLLFKHNEIYRVFQQQGFDNYGEAIGIAKIKALTTETYTEEFLYKIPADFFKDLTGAHTYSFTKGLLVLDYKRLENIKN